MLIKINKFLRSNPYIVAFLCIIMLNISCNKDEVLNPTQPQWASEIALKKSNPDFDAETLFKGIAFAQGPVAERISQLNGLQITNFINDTAIINQIFAAQDEIVSDINSQFPNFLAAFKVAMQSGKHLEIKTMLAHTANIIPSILENKLIELGGVLDNDSLTDPLIIDIFGEMAPNPNNKGIELRDILLGRISDEDKVIAVAEDILIAKDLFVAVELAVIALSVVAIIIVAVAIGAAVICHETLTEDFLNKHGLHQDMMINEIAFNLKPTN